MRSSPRSPSARRWLLRALAAAALALPACSGDNPSAPTPAVSEAAASAAPAPAKVASQPITEVAMPAEAIGVVAASDPATLLADLTKTVQAVQPGARPLEGDLLPLVGRGFRLQSTAAIDLKRSASLAFFDLKKYSKAGFVASFHVTSRDELLAAAPADRRENVSGNQYAWGDVFVNFDGDVVFLSGEEALFPTHGDFLRRLGAASSGPGASAVISIDHVGALYRADLDAAAKQFGAMASAPEAKSMEATFAMMSTALTELDTVTIDLRPAEGGLVLDFGAKPKALSTWNVAFRSLTAAAENPLAPKLPKESHAAAYATFPPSSRDVLLKYFEWATSLSGMESLGGAMAGYKDVVESMTGDMAFGLFQLEGQSAPSLLAISGVTDAAKVKAAQRKMGEALKNADVKSAAGGKLKMSFKKAAYKIGDVEVDVTKTEMEGAPPGLGDLMSWVGEGHSAVTKSEALLAYGPTARATLEAYLGGKVTGGLDASAMVIDAKKHGVKGAIATAAFSASHVMSMLGVSQAAVSKGAVSMTFGAVGGALHFVLHVPDAQLLPLAGGLEALQRAAMGAGPPKRPGPSGPMLVPSPKQR